MADLRKPGGYGDANLDGPCYAGTAILSYRETQQDDKVAMLRADLEQEEARTDLLQADLDAARAEITLLRADLAAMRTRAEWAEMRVKQEIHVVKRTESEAYNLRAQLIAALEAKECAERERDAAKVIASDAVQALVAEAHRRALRANESSGVK